MKQDLEEHVFANRTLLPTRPVDVVLSPFARFMRVEAAGGIVLLLFTAAALVIANSPYARPFADFWELPIAITIAGFSLKDHLGHLIVNDGLMTIFFFVIGLEIKREAVEGELRDPVKARLPLFAAVGGMVAPALLYTAMQWGQPGFRGWAIPMATDIAFVVGFLTLLGSRVPSGLKILLLTLAVVDDLGAVLLIAFVFSGPLAWEWLVVAAGGFLLIALFNRIGVRRVGVYVVVGACIWLAFLKSGVHSTVAGVLLGLMTPSSAWLGDQDFRELADNIVSKILRGELSKREIRSYLVRLEFAAREWIAPLDRLQEGLHYWVAFAIMPLFVFANAGVELQPEGWRSPIAIAVAVGLVVGKPLGIVLASALAIRMRWASLPSNVHWRHLVGGGCLAGIGFTMALFLNSLAFPAHTAPEMQSAGKIGILTGSLLSAILGVAILWPGKSDARIALREIDELTAADSNDSIGPPRQEPGRCKFFA